MRALTADECREVAGGFYFGMWRSLHNAMAGKVGDPGHSGGNRNGEPIPVDDRHGNVAPGRASRAYGSGWGEDNNGMG